MRDLVLCPRRQCAWSGTLYFQLVRLSRLPSAPLSVPCLSRSPAYKRPSLEEAVSSFFPVLDMTETCCVKNAVICVTELIAAFIPTCDLLSLLADVIYGLFNQSCKYIWLSVDHCRLRPMEHVISSSCTIDERGFVVFCYAECTLTSRESRFNCFVTPLPSCVPVT